jgi:hypothetical protein
MQTEEKQSMKRLLPLSALLMLAASAPALTNPLPWGGIDPCGDAGGSVHFMYDTGPGMLNVYIVDQAQYTMGISGSRFSAPAPECFVGTYLSETHPLGGVGDSRTGITVLYGACMGGPVHVLTIHYYVEGLTPQCCMYWTVPDPSAASGRVEIRDCDGVWRNGYGGGGFINPDQRTLCGTPVKQTTWGGIKALYH